MPLYEVTPLPSGIVDYLNNICVVIQEMHELGIDGRFTAPEEV